MVPDPRSGRVTGYPDRTRFWSDNVRIVHNSTGVVEKYNEIRLGLVFRDDAQRRSAGQGDAMKILRSVNRRGSSTESIGFYTLLRPNKWFAASRLSGSFHFLTSRSKSAVLLPALEQKSPNQADSNETANLLQTMKPKAHGDQLVWSVLIFLGALAITSLLLWWIMVGAPPNKY